MAVTSSIGHGLEIGRRALGAQQAALNATSHNIANANTPGFSRRQANLQSVGPGISGGIGTGVDLGSVERQRSRFLDAQVRVEQQVLGRWVSMERSMQAIEILFNEPAGAGSSEAGTVFNEPSGTGLSGSLSRFWNTWQDLANVPESGAACAALRQEGIFLSEMLHQYNDQLLHIHQELNNSIIDEAGEINEILDQLALINREIPRANFEGGSAADLEDARDHLLDRLSFKVDISTVEKPNGQVSVLLSGHNLVENDQAVHLRVRHLSARGLPLAQLVFADDGTIANVREGRLQGLIEARDEIIPSIVSRLDEMAVGMVEEMNLLHKKGFGSNGSTGVNFFDEGKVNASNITLDDAILDDLSNIAASGDGEVGDNGNALAISGLRNKRILAGGTATVDQFYYELLGDVGARSKEAQTMATTPSARFTVGESTPERRRCIVERRDGAANPVPTRLPGRRTNRVDHRQSSRSHNQPVVERMKTLHNMAAIITEEVITNDRPKTGIRKAGFVMDRKIGPHYIWKSSRRRYSQCG